MWLALTMFACDGGKDETDTTPTPTGDTGPALQTDVFEQTLISPIDILWVIDPGWQDGMDGLEGALDKAYETLLLADPSWRIGIMNPSISPTTPSFGLIGAKFETYPAPSNAFSLTGTEPPSIRQAIYTALELRREHGSNAEFLRSDASLYILVFTDSEDASDNDVITKNNFKSWVEGIEPSESVRLGAITTSESAAYWQDMVIGDASVREVGSYRAAISDQLREAIGQKITWQLSQVPSVPPEVVTVLYREKTEDYEVGSEVIYDPNANTITFDDYVPPPDAEIHVSYEVGTTEPEPTTPEEPAE